MALLPQMVVEYQNYRGSHLVTQVLTRLALIAAMSLAALAPGQAQEVTPKLQELAGSWVVTIPQAFPLHVFNWTVDPDGTYQESGRNAINGQRTLVSGRWTLDGVHAVMTQNNEGFVFDGTLAGGCYIGRLFQNGKNISSFTARKRGSTVRACNGDVTI
jgi:hypothetical protein